MAAHSGGGDFVPIHPVLGNVAFSAGYYGWSFTLESFAHLYCDVSGGGFDPRYVGCRSSCGK